MGNGVSIHPCPPLRMSALATVLRCSRKGIDILDFHIGKGIDILNGEIRSGVDKFPLAASIGETLHLLYVQIGKGIYHFNGDIAPRTDDLHFAVEGDAVERAVVGVELFRVGDLGAECDREGECG